MRNRDVARKVIAARKSVQKDISAFASSGGGVARGLAGEGYNGGYRDALDDVLLLLNGVIPERNGWWTKTDSAEKGR